MGRDGVVGGVLSRAMMKTAASSPTGHSGRERVGSHGTEGRCTCTYSALELVGCISSNARAENGLFEDFVTFLFT